MAKAFVENDEIMLLSPTGSGKTLAFLLPILAQLNPEIDQVQALVLAPSRELALQIEEVFKSMKTPYKVNCCYGGHAMKVERNNLSNPPAVLIGTPGRIADHLDKETFSTEALTTIVFDEFDKSLEFGFTEEMGYILSQLPAIKKKVLISATQAIQVPDFLEMDKCSILNYLSERKQIEGLSIRTVWADDPEKLEVFLKLICLIGSEQPCLVFCNHRDAVDRLGNHLAEHGIVSARFHGGLDQRDREEVLAMFRNGSTHILVTTDLAARGLDIPDVKHIIHYQKPITEETFIHRNGRTARMGKEGTAYIMLTDQDEVPKYISKRTQALELPEEMVLPRTPVFITLFVSKGKKDKINKMDVVGFLSKVGGLGKDDIGLIEVKDFFAYVAISREKSAAVLKKITGQKIKNQTVKFSLL